MKPQIGDIYIAVEWPESQKYDEHYEECIAGADGDITFVPLKIYNKVNHIRVAVVDKTND